MPEQNLLHCPKCNEEFPAQGRERYVYIVEAIRENQQEAGWILAAMSNDDTDTAKEYLDLMRPMDRQAILLEGGILRPEQIEALK